MGLFPQSIGLGNTYAMRAVAKLQFLETAMLSPAKQNTRTYTRNRHKLHTDPSRGSSPTALGEKSSGGYRSTGEAGWGDNDELAIANA